MSSGVAGEWMAPTFSVPAAFMNASMSRNHAVNRRRSPAACTAPAAPISVSALGVRAQAAGCPA